MSKFKLYSTNAPYVKSLVNFIFTEHCADCMKCHLIDFNTDAIMPYHLATLKNTIKSINTLAPLNKPMIGIVEEANDIIVISIAYIDKDSDEYVKFLENNINNKRLITCVKQYACKNKLNYIETWERIVYPLDRIREDISLFDYTLAHLNKYEYIELFEIIQNNNILHIQHITPFKMISNSGINSIKQLISTALTSTKLSDDVRVLLISPPNYTIISDDTNKNTIFLQTLVELCKHDNIDMSY